jgi:hypothetical protein
MTKKREPFPPELIKKIRETGELAILAGCTAEEIIALSKQTVKLWARHGSR